jgi:hypothetical protein
MTGPTGEPQGSSPPHGTAVSARNALEHGMLARVDAAVPLRQ